MSGNTRAQYTSSWRNSKESSAQGLAGNSASPADSKNLRACEPCLPGETFTVYAWAVSRVSRSSDVVNSSSSSTDLSPYCRIFRRTLHRTGCLYQARLRPNGGAGGGRRGARLETFAAYGPSRECGADDMMADARFADSGPSPQVRGRRCQRVELCPLRRTTPGGTGRQMPVDVDGRGDRTIPASAWPTCRQSGRRRRGTDHPCGCGADRCRDIFQRVLHGPSPRVRGRPLRPRDRSIRLRTIPRECEADCAPRPPPPLVHGPSPRVQGRLQIVRGGTSPPRTIPACARPTIWWMTGAWPGQDHPRVCGANVRWRRMVAMTPGPSPRVRGRRTPDGPSSVCSRTIPACAGPTMTGCAR